MGKGGSKAPSDVTQRQISLPEFSEPYYERMLAGAEQALMPFREVGTGEFDAEGNEIMRTESTYQGYGQTQVDPLTGEEVFIPTQRLASGAEIGDIAASRGMVRDIAGSAIPGIGQSAAAFSRGIGALQNLANYAPGQFYEAQVSPYYGFQETGVSPYAGFDRASFSPYAGFQAGEASPYAGFGQTVVSPYADFREGQVSQAEFAATRVSPFADFREGEVSPYAGFQETQVSPYAGFQETQVSPYAGFQEAQFSQYRPDEFTGFRETGVTTSRFDPTRQFSGAEVSSYMSPYMEQVVSRQADEARRQFDISSAGRAAQAVQAGAFGGSRQAVQEALAEEGLQRQLGDIYAGGQQQAFESAQQAFQADRAAQFAREQAQVQEIARTQGITVEEAARVQQSRAQEAARVQAMEQQELARFEASRAAEMARVQQAQAAELARVQGISVDEAARIQQAQAAELARVQGISVEEASRVQQAEAAELARTQGISIDEAARIQAARAGELARTQGIDVQEQARVQSSIAGEIARTQGISIEEAARVQQSQAAELARIQGISVEEAARVQAAQAAELARTQGISIEEAARVQQSQAAELSRIQSADASEIARIQQAQAAELARVQGISVEEAARIQAAQAAELARVQGISVDEAARVQAAREASRQFGYGQALAAEQAALGAAEGLFGLGERARAGDIQAAQLLEAIGKDQLAERQAALDLDYQRFLEERDYPSQQYERFANLLAGLPAGFDVSTQGYQQYNPTQQALGAGISALGLYNAYNR